MPSVVQVPWKYISPAGEPTYYRGTNRPVAVVLHRMQGWATTAHQWALSGHYGASWHYTVSLAGDIMQHLRHEDGGYHAGIGPNAKTPTWPLWRGHGQNVNTYTIGIECEGFEGGDWPAAQLESLRWLCRKLALDLGIPYDREHFPAHAEIDVVNRVNDFDRPERRHIVYDYLFAEDGMTDDDLLAIFSGKEEAHLPREKRIENARYRRDQAAAGEAPSIRELAASAYTLATAPLSVPAAILPSGISAERIGEALAHGAKAAAGYLANAAQKDNGG